MDAVPARVGRAAAADREQAQAPATAASTTRSRNEAIDWLRGAVMVLMALDHTRAFLGSPVELDSAGPALFFTRWITHLCAPVFVLLAGTAAYLHGRRLGSTRVLASYLLKRGAWLILLEVTVVRVAWILQIGPEILFLQVIWAIGASMVVLAALVWLPRPAIALAALVVIGAHNLLDAVRAEQLGSERWLWLLLHQPGSVEPFAGAHWFILYPLIPWVAVMAAGYVLGPWALLPRNQRRRRFARLGVALIASFVLLRASNLYGDPHPWTAEQGLVHGVLSFLNCEKYPPSLLYLAMTLGPASCALAWMDRPLGPWAKRVSLYGRVPLFYYVLHLYLIHAVAIAVASADLGSGVLTRPFLPSGALGYSLPAVYTFWAAVVVVLYPACRWFAAVKQRSHAAWMSYL
jgi:uncharacterized membrane protein